MLFRSRRLRKRLQQHQLHRTWPAEAPEPAVLPEPPLGPVELVLLEPFPEAALLPLLLGVLSVLQAASEPTRARARASARALLFIAVSSHVVFWRSHPRFSITRFFAVSPEMAGRIGFFDRL